VRIEILVFDGCPNARAAEELVRRTVDELAIDANVVILNVEDDHDAVAKRFLGSPSIRINGKDIEIEENAATQYSMRCRVYRIETGHTGVPSKELILKAIQTSA
jgi:hypothetical protein